MAARRTDAVVTGLVVAVLVVLAASALLLLLPRGDAPARASGSSSTADAGTAPSEDGTGEDDAAGTDGADGAVPVTDVSGREASFRTPTGNIGCATAPASGGDSASVRCEIGDRAWQPPPQPAGCRAQWGGGLALTGTSEVLCTDAPLGVVGAPDGTVDVLDYGTALKQGSVTCTSGEEGLRCTDAGTGGGFVLSRGGYELF